MRVGETIKDNEEGKETSGKCKTEVKFYGKRKCGNENYDACKKRSIRKNNQIRNGNRMKRKKKRCKKKATSAEILDKT